MLRKSVVQLDCQGAVCIAHDGVGPVRVVQILLLLVLIQFLPAIQIRFTPLGERSESRNCKNSELQEGTANGPRIARLLPN